MRIKFFVGESVFTNKKRECMQLNPAYYFLKAYYEKVGKHYDQYTWLQTEYFLDSYSELLERVENEKADILCFSMFVWNWEYYYDFIKLVKQKHPHIKIIVGGPEVHPEKDKEFFTKFPHIDYAVYNEGEHAFSQLLDSFYSDDDCKFTNLATKDKVYPYRMFKFKDEPKFNAYLDFKEELKKDYELIRSLNYNNIVLSYERVKGCPYKCSFCDWHQGNHKINIRSTDWKDELDFISSLDSNTYVMDANFGIFEEDLTLFDYALDLHKKNNNFILGISNVAKLHKDRVYYMYDKLLEVNPRYRIKISLQDLNSEVLDNIDRPEIPWHEHRQYLIDLREKHKNSRIEIEIINGLPGSTKEKILTQYVEFADVRANSILIHYWIMLIGSPAYDKSYREKHHIGSINTFVVQDKVIDNPDVNNMLTGEVISNGHFAEMLYDQNLGIDGLIYNNVMSEFYKAIAAKHNSGYSLSKEIFLSEYARYENFISKLTKYIVSNMQTVKHGDKEYLLWAVVYKQKLYSYRLFLQEVFAKTIK